MGLLVTAETGNVRLPLLGQVTPAVKPLLQHREMKTPDSSPTRAGSKLWKERLRTPAGHLPSSKKADSPETAARSLRVLPGQGEATHQGKTPARKVSVAEPPQTPTPSGHAATEMRNQK